MRISGISKKISILSILFFTLNHISTAQSWGQCGIVICTEEDCNDVNVTFATPSGGVSFCESAIVPLINNSPTDFTFYVVDWTDGNKDTIYIPIGDTIFHQYHVPDSLLCNGNIGMQVCFKGVLKCDTNKISCAWASYGFTLKVRPKAKLNLQQQYCIHSPVSMIESSCNAIGYSWTFGDGNTSTQSDPLHTYSTPGVYNVRLIVTNACGSDTAFASIVIVDYPLAEVNWNLADDTVCINEVHSFHDVTTSLGATTLWNIVPNDTLKWIFNDTLMSFNSTNIDVKFLQTGTYTMTLTANNACGTNIWTQDIVVLDGPSLNLSQGPTLCITNAIYTPVINYTGQNQIQSYQWSFAGGIPASSNVAQPGNITFSTPGTHNVSLTIQSECGQSTVSTIVTVDNLPLITLPFVPSVYCSGSMPDTLHATPFGGIWTGQGITSDSIFDPGAVLPGTYTLTYTAGNGTCVASSDLTVNVVSSEIVTVVDTSLCENTSTVQLQATPFGGSWSGVGIIDTIGQFDPAVSGIGSFQPVYNYPDSNGCVVDITANVIVQAFPIVSLLDNFQLCNVNTVSQLADILQLTLSPSGGIITWTLNGLSSDGTINGSTLSNTQNVKVTYKSGACTVSDSAMITIISPPVLQFANDTTLCIQDSTFQIVSNLNGNWTGPGVDINTGIVNLYFAGAGTHQYGFEYQPGTTCERKDSLQITINDPGISLNAGSDISLCAGQSSSYTFSGFSPAGGAWTGQSLTDSIAGNVNLLSLQADSIYAYFYCLNDMGTSGCRACDRLELIIHSLPDAGITLNGTTCINTQFTLSPDFCDLTSAYSWDLGDGTLSSGCIVNHAYTTDGDYQVSLHVASQYGCLNDEALPVHVTAPPVALFDVVIDEGCAPFPLELINSSSGEIGSQLWLIAGDSVSGPNPGILILDGFADDSLVIIELQISNVCAIVSDFDSVLVHPYPIVDFGLNVDDGCSPLIIDFGNATTGNPVTWLWDLGDGTYSTDSVPAPHMYTSPHDSTSLFTIQLISSNTCGADTQSHVLTVYPPDVTAFIQLDTTSGCQPLSLTAHSISTPGATVGWQVVGPDGKITGSTDNDPVFILDQPGLHMIILTAARCGADFDTAYVDVLPAPFVDFAFDPVVCQGETISFQNLSIDVTSVNWDFGDNTQSALFSPTHSYTVPGNYLVSLTESSILNNCPITITRNLQVHPTPVISIDNSPLNGCPPFDVSFINNGLQGLSYVWNFMDGTSFSNAYAPDHIFLESGIYEVEVFAYDSIGCFSETTIITVTVFPVPVAAFDYEKANECGVPADVSFNNLSTGGLAYDWSFGDGNNSVVVHPVHSFQSAGDYTISLSVSNIYLCKDTAILPVSIYEQPLADFSILNPLSCQLQPVVILDQSLHANEYYWYLNGDLISEDANPVLHISDTGVYYLTLIAKYNDYCRDTLTLDPAIYVYQLPTSDFTYTANQDPSILGDIQFQNLSTLFDRDFWDFGDSTSSVELDPLHEYDINRPVQVILYAFNGNGGALTCIDTSIQDVNPEWLTTFYAPNAFSPDHGEGLVRVFKPVGIGLSSYDISVYSPWGQRVWHSTAIEEQHPSESWNGRLDNTGEELPQGAFTWLAKVVFVNGDSRVYKGSVTVLK
ncbi:MAG TPA: PKD domain-containing protein [Saprospiraceae bacterium]|nr:PKD domain-containing protein [Saprospiraceae bacterium]